jgi:glyoxylase-like metal-dependent hydrolase (beta-lactamase superfamily II)
MTYTGEVSPGGAPDLRVLPDATIGKLSVSTMDNNCYLITCSATQEQLLVDAADEAPRLLEWQRDSGGRLAEVLTTHRHWDHHRALKDVVEATGVRTSAGRDDADEIPVRPGRRLEQGDRLEVGRLGLDVVHLRGHTPGSVALVLTSSDGSVHAFTGDSLFPGGVGGTFGDADAFRQLVDDVEERLFAVLPDETWVYPGHGKDTTIGAERPSLPEWRARGW